MNTLNYTIQLSQVEMDDLRGRMAQALATPKPVVNRRSFKAVGRVPYPRRKYRGLSLSEIDRIVNREVF